MSSEPKLLDQVRDVLRRRHYSYKTEKSYIHCIKQFIAFHNMKPPRDMGSSEVKAFLTYLAVAQQVAPSTQNQAFSALIFLYREVYERDTNWQLNAERAAAKQYLPTVLTPEETQSILKSKISILLSAKSLSEMAKDEKAGWQWCPVVCLSL
jgi:site-specific recombinase XerD